MKTFKLEMSQAQIALLQHCVREWQKQQKPVPVEIQKRIAEHGDEFGDLGDRPSTDVEPSQYAVDLELDFLDTSFGEACDPDTEYADREIVSLVA